MSYPVLVLLSCVFLSAGIAPAPALGQPASRPTPVIVADVARQPLSDTIEALGTLRANESVSITSNVTETISVVHFDDGQRVAAGDLLVEMTNAEEHALLDEAQVRVGEAERQFQRVKSLATQRSASESLLDERKRDLETTRAMLVALESRLADRIVKAPFSGVLGLRNISRGALVEPGDLITTLDDDRVMKLDFSVPSLHLNALVPGLAIEAATAAFPERTFTGVVRGVDSRIDPVTRSVVVRALIPNPDARLRPGLLMQVTLLTHPREAILIPESAVLHQGRDHFVMVVVEHADGVSAERRQIQIGTRKPGLVEVREGLTLGERVVTDGSDKVRAGQSLVIQSVEDGTRDRRAMTERAQ